MCFTLTPRAWTSAESQRPACYNLLETAVHALSLYIQPACSPSLDVNQTGAPFALCPIISICSPFFPPHVKVKLIRFSRATHEASPFMQVSFSTARPCPLLPGTPRPIPPVGPSTSGSPRLGSMSTRTRLQQRYASGPSSLATCPRTSLPLCQSTIPFSNPRHDNVAPPFKHSDGLNACSQV